MNNPRSMLKTWPILFCCLNIGAVTIMLAPGYSTGDFLTKWEQFTSIRGSPRFVYTDRGSNLTKAMSFITEDKSNLAGEKIVQKTAVDGTTWKFSPEMVLLRVV